MILEEEPVLMYGCEAWTISKQPKKSVIVVKNEVNLMDDEEIQ